MKISTKSLPLRLTALAAALSFSAALLADTHHTRYESHATPVTVENTPLAVTVTNSPSPQTVQPSQMVTLMSSGAKCLNGYYAVDSVINHDATVSEFNLPSGTALVLTQANFNGNTYLSIESATGVSAVILQLSGSYSAYSLSDTAVYAGTRLCMYTNVYSTFRIYGHIVAQDN